MDEREKLRAWVAALDAPHQLYAKEYADELALGEPAPSMIGRGLDRALVREIRRRVWQEWQRRIKSMGGGRGEHA